MNIEAQIERYWKEEPELYEAYFQQNSSLSFKNYFVKFQKDRMKRIASLVGIKKGDKLIDVGCGPGHYDVLFYNLGAKLTCIDYSRKMLDMARKNLDRINAKGCRLVLSDADRLGETADFYDIGTAIGLFDYIVEVDSALSELVRVVKKKGMILATFPSKKSPFFFFRTKVGNFFRRFLFGAPPIINTFGKNDIISLFSRHGIKPVHFEKVHETMWIVKGIKQ